MDYTLIIFGIIAVGILGYLFYTKKITKEMIKTRLSRKTINCSEEQLDEIKKAVLSGDKSILNIVKNTKPKKEFIPGPDQVAVLSIEKNGNEFRFDYWNADEPGVVTNNDRGRSADLGQTQPVTFVIQGKAHIGFIVEGDRGVGLKLDQSVLKLTTTAREAWDFIQSAKLRSFLTENLTGRQIALYMILGIIIGQLIFFFAGV
nr:hypothetical protein [uncultured Methanoregula sp.]